MNVAKITRSLALLASLTLITACGGGGGGSSGNPAAQGTNFDSGCTGSCATSMPANLTVADVQQIIAQAVQESTAIGAASTIAVSDRVGNILAVFQMNGAARTFTIRSGLVATGNFQGLENIAAVPSDLAAIAKAVTGAYLASEGNAFTTRTASHIIQEHFNPLEFSLPGGPLFGVQFSQLPCGDLVQQGNALGVGPRRSPLGFSADPGGLPLYKNGHPVGGIGVISDGFYSLDRNISDNDRSIAGFPEFNARDELIAIAGQFGYAPSVDRQANRITVDGRSLRYTDVDSDDLSTSPQTASFAAINGVSGNLIDDNRVNLADVNNPLSAQNYFVAGGGVRAGTTFGQANSGIRPADAIDATLFPGLDAFVLTDGAGTNRFPPIDGAVIAGNNQLTAADVTQLLRSALDVANRARAQIRRPLNSQARVTISVVDSAGNIVGIVRTRDAPIFGTDVSLQKARTATFFSSTDADVRLIETSNADLTGAGIGLTYVSDIGNYVEVPNGVRSFVGATALSDGTAFADRSGGNLSRPYYPDGVLSGPNGPFSKPFTAAGNLASAASEWSPFNVGLQLDLIYNRLIGHLAGGNNTSCTDNANLTTRIANGIQIFPGSVPIYRNGVLIGGIGVSGDGIEQDDMISFLGTANASIALGNPGGIGNGATIGNAPIAMRADQLTLVASPTNNLRYVQCPQNPFIGSSANLVCDGL